MTPRTQMIMLGGSPGAGIRNCMLVEHELGAAIITQIKHIDFKNKELIFYENSTKNFLFFILALCFKIVTSHKICYFVHGDHFLPEARSQYSVFTLLKEIVFIKLADEVYSHSFMSLAITKKVLKIHQKKFKRRRFSFDVYKTLLTKAGFFDGIDKGDKKPSIGVVEYARKNKNTYVQRFTTQDGVTIIRPGANLKFDVCQYTDLAITSETESLSLLAIEAAVGGVQRIHLHKRIGLKEYREELDALGVSLLFYE